MDKMISGSVSVFSLLKDALVPFEASHVDAKVVWRSDECTDTCTQLLNSCAYLVDGATKGRSKTFYAERYGGNGISRNGGGARCGFDGRYHIKGIGPNPLVGEGTDPNHSDGALALYYAVYEMVWGNILDAVLPYGAVRVQAILATDFESDIGLAKRKTRQRRGLIVREPLVRPAHFERAIYFKPQARYQHLLVHDAERVRRIIPRLADCLPRPQEMDEQEWKQLALVHRCTHGLCELAKRYAYQMAFCRTRFLLMTTSPSNVTMNGRLLDFNAVHSLFPVDHSHDLDYRMKLEKMAREPATLLDGLESLCIYLGKYLLDQGYSRETIPLIQAAFTQNFAKACRQGYLELAGFPIQFLDDIERHPPLIALADMIAYLIRHDVLYGNQSSFSVVGKPEFFSVLASLHDRPVQCIAELSRPSIKPAVLDELCSIYQQAFDIVRVKAGAVGITLHKLINVMADSAVRYSAPRKELDRISMYNDISDHILLCAGRDQDLVEWIHFYQDNKIREAVPLLSSFRI